MTITLFSPPPIDTIANPKPTTTAPPLNNPSYDYNPHTDVATVVILTQDNL